MGSTPLLVLTVSAPGAQVTLPVSLSVSARFVPATSLSRAGVLLERVERNHVRLHAVVFEVRDRHVGDARGGERVVASVGARHIARDDRVRDVAVGLRVVAAGHGDGLRDAPVRGGEDELPRRNRALGRVARGDRDEDVGARRLVQDDREARGAAGLGGLQAGRRVDGDAGREQPEPFGLRGDADDDSSLDCPGPELEVPVPALRGRAGRILGGGHVGPGEPGNGVDQRLAALRGRKIAAVEEDIALLGERLAPLLDRRRALEQRVEVELRGAELHRPVGGVADDVDRVEIGLLRERVGDLADAVALGVDQHELELDALFQRRRAHRFHQRLVLGRGGVDEHQLMRALERRHLRRGDHRGRTRVRERAKLRALQGGGG